MPRIQHVSVPRPPGSEAATRAFYGGLLGLREVPVPQSIQYLDIIWFRMGEMELHVFAEEPPDDPDSSGRHFCLEVDDVEATRTALTEAGYDPWDGPPIPGRPRFFCRDPFGNAIEFTRIEGDYRALE